jgi:hypothetical protein
MWGLAGWVIIGELMIFFITLEVARGSDRLRLLVVNNTVMYLAGILIGWRLL